MNQRVTTIIDILKLKSTPTAILFQVNQITKFQIPNINAATAWMLVFTSFGYTLNLLSSIYAERYE